MAKKDGRRRRKRVAEERREAARKRREFPTEEISARGVMLMANMAEEMRGNGEGEGGRRGGQALLEDGGRTEGWTRRRGGGRGLFRARERPIDSERRRHSSSYGQRNRQKRESGRGAGREGGHEEGRREGDRDCGVGREREGVRERAGEHAGRESVLWRRWEEKLEEEVGAAKR